MRFHIVQKGFSNIDSIMLVLTFLTSSVVGEEVGLAGGIVGLMSVVVGSVGMSGGCFDGAFAVGSTFLNVGRDVVGFSPVVTDGFLGGFLDSFIDGFINGFLVGFLVDEQVLENKA